MTLKLSNITSRKKSLRVIGRSLTQFLDPSLETLKEYVHFSCTSEDINNLSYSLMMSDANKKVICTNLDTLLNKLEEMATTNAKVAMLCRTHGQPATPSTIGKEIANFAYRVGRQYNYIKDVYSHKNSIYSVVQIPWEIERRCW